MVIGLHNKNKSDINIGVTGIAGPSGGSTLKPVGTVFFSFYIKKKQKPLVLKKIFKGTRYNIRLKASLFAIKKTLEMLN